MVVTEDAVNARRHRGRGGGERRVGRVPEGRQHDPGPHHNPPARTASAPPTAPARSPKAAGAITSRDAGLHPRPARRRWRGPSRAGGRRPGSPRRRARSTRGRARQSGWPGRSRSTNPTSRITRCAAGSPAAAAADTSSPRTLSGSPPAIRTTSPRRPARAASRASTPSPAPEAKRSQQPRRPQGHGGPFGSTTMWPISPAKPAAPTCTCPSITRPPPMPVPSVTMTTWSWPRAAPRRCSASTAKLASFSIRQSAPGQLVADQLVPVHALGLRQVGGEAEPPRTVHHARGAHADGRRCRGRCRAGEGAVESGDHVGHRRRDVAAHDVAGALRGGDPGLGHDGVGPVQGDAEDLGPADVDAVGDVGGRLAPVGSHESDSTRAFSSRMAVAMMRLVARILMKPGNGHAQLRLEVVRHVGAPALAGVEDVAAVPAWW